MAWVASPRSMKLTHGSPGSTHRSSDSASARLLQTSTLQPLEAAAVLSSSKASRPGWTCLRSSARSGKDLQIFLATQWLAMIMHSATVSWILRCSFGLISLGSEETDSNSKRTSLLLSSLRAPSFSRSSWTFCAILLSMTSVSLSCLTFFCSP